MCMQYWSVHVCPCADPVHLAEGNKLVKFMGRYFHRIYPPKVTDITGDACENRRLILLRENLNPESGIGMGSTDCPYTCRPEDREREPTILTEQCQQCKNSGHVWPPVPPSQDTKPQGHGAPMAPMHDEAWKKQQQ